MYVAAAMWAVCACAVRQLEPAPTNNRIWSCACVHRARARGDLVCCSYNSVAENIVRDHASPVTHTRRLYALRCTRVRCDASCSKRAHHPRASPVAAEGEAGPAPEAGCRSSRRRGNLKPYAHNLSPCHTAICASAPMPCQCHVARTCRPLKLTLDLCLHAPASPIPCAEAGRSMSRPHRPRRRHLLCRVPSRSPAPFVVVSPMPFCAVARPRAACCSPPSPPARPCHVPWLAQVSPAPPSASPHSYATCAVALDCASLGVGALSCRVPLRSTFAVALDCASLGVAALSCRVPLRLTAPFVVDAVAQECSCLQNQGCGKNQSRPDGHKWRGESRLRSTLGALVGLATILRRRSARPHEDIVPHQTFG